MRAVLVFHCSEDSGRSLLGCDTCISVGFDLNCLLRLSLGI
jgi:hypothetical protein